VYTTAYDVYIGESWEIINKESLGSHTKFSKNEKQEPNLNGPRA